MELLGETSSLVCISKLEDVCGLLLRDLLKHKLGGSSLFCCVELCLLDSKQHLWSNHNIYVVYPWESTKGCFDHQIEYNGEGETASNGYILTRVFRGKK